MRNLLQLIIRYSNFLLFLGLEVVAFIFVVRGNRYQYATMHGAANVVVGGMQQAHNSVVSYFRLKSDNELLLEENARLHEQIMALENRQEAGGYCQDSTAGYIFADRDYQYIPARVIAYSVDRHHNYLTLNRGVRDGVTTDMGVIGKDGIVGVVQSVSNRFCVVAPVIHEGIYISSMLQKNGYLATLHWHSPDVSRAGLEDVARHVDITDGDTIVTSGMSAIFPANIPVGVVEQVKIGEGDSYYTVDVALATDFHSLRTVQILNFAHRNELDSIQ